MSYDGVSPGAGRRSSRRTSVAPEGGDEDPQAVVVRNLWRRRYLLPPYQSRWSARRRYWGLVLLACSFYESFAIPFQLAFYHSAAGVPPTLPQLLVGYAIDLAFWVEILLTFRTCIETSLEEGSEIVSDTALIARRYLRGTFALDLLGVLPIEIFALAAPGGITSMGAQALRLNRLLRLSRFVTAHGDAFNRLTKLKRLLVKTFIWLAFAHWVACWCARPPNARPPNP